MKMMAVAAIVCGLAMGVAAQEANLLKNNWRLYSGTKTTVIDAKSGVITCKNTEPNTNAGVVQGVVLNQTAPKAITFSAESKATDVKGTAGANYCLYLDITLADGSKVWGRLANFKAGTHDWEKAQTTYTPAKPIKSLSYYVLFRKMTGEASFRNMTLTQAK